jgi:hypothetical protein
MRLSRTSVVGLVVALGAGAALLFLVPGRDEPAPPARTALAQAWPSAQRAEFPGNLRDGPIFQPGLFLDARTAIGTAPSPDAGSLRLVLRGAEGDVRELRRRPLDGQTAFENFTAAGETVAWTEAAADGRVEIWAAEPRAGPARRLTADTGDPVFYGSQYDLVIGAGRVHWASAAGGGKVTEIRSVPLTGWPGITNGAADPAGATVLRELTGNREIRVPATGTELARCTPAWCRMTVLATDGLARIDVMRPDGTGRKRIAGRGAAGAIPDVALLDRFEVLAEARPDSDLSGEEGLLVHDLTTGRTIDLGAAVTGAYARNGVVWWSTGDQDSLIWHTVDLRTV